MSKELFLQKVLIPQNIEKYKRYLLQDFDLYPTERDLAADLFLAGRDLAKWVETAQVDNFNSYRTGYADQPLDAVRKPEHMDRLNLPDELIETIKEQEALFTKLKYDQPDQFVANEFPHYFILPDDFVAKMDAIFFERLAAIAGYSVSKNKKVLSKKISENCALQFLTKRREFNFFSLENYTFPEMVAIIDEQPYYLFNSTDIKPLLFLAAPSFIFFYIHSNEFIRDENGNVIRVQRKIDEPVTSYDEEGKFIVQNSTANKERYLKFMMTTNWLFTHYLKVFEKWFMENILPDRQRLVDEK